MAKLLSSLALSTLIAWAAFGQNEIRKMIVFPVEAIVDSSQVSHEQFKKRYPGINVTSFGLTDEGWYIRYNHEAMVYMFGPIYDLTYAREQKLILEQVRLSAILRNPKLSSSKIDLIRFDFQDTLNDKTSNNKFAPKR